MQIPLGPGDEVASAAPIYEQGRHILLVVTRAGFVFRVEFYGPTQGWVVQAL